MKHFAYLLLILISLSSCQTEEKRAEKFLDTWLSEHMPEYPSYEPISTTVDSAFTNLYTDFDINVSANVLMNYISDYENGMNTLLQTGDMVERYIRDYSPRGRVMYEMYKAGWDEQLSNLKEIAWCGNRTEDEILEKCADFVPEYMGKGIWHKYRYRTSAGENSIREDYFIADDDFTKVIEIRSSDDQKTQMIKAVISTVQTGHRYWGDYPSKFVEGDMNDRWNRR